MAKPKVEQRELGKNPPTLEMYLERRGIRPNSTFGDYQDYIEEQQKKLPTKLVRPEAVPVEGSIHLALGRILRVKDCDKL